MSEPPGVRRDVLEVHERCFIVDAHADTVLHAVRGERHFAHRSEKGHVDLPRLAEAGVDVQFFAHYIEPEYKPDRGLFRFLQILDVFYHQLEEGKDLAEVALSAGDIRHITGQGKIACIIAVEGGEAIQGDLGVLRMLHRLGVRSFGLTWNQRNLLADGVGETRTGGGLTRAGVEAVRELNRLGILVDVSHLSEPGFWDVLEVTGAPVIASHSNARAICDHPRNLSDRQIRALAENGGVMGLNFCPAFVQAEDPSVEHLLHHVDHIVSLVGVDHVGLGSDFDGISATPRGLEDVTCLPRFTQCLVDNGYSCEAVEKLLGGNFMRVMDEVLK